MSYSKDVCGIPVSRDSINWTWRHAGTAHDVAVPIAHSIPGDGDDLVANPGIVGFMGVGEGIETAQLLVEGLAEQGVGNFVIGVLPIDHEYVTKDNIELALQAVGTEVPLHVYKDTQSRLGDTSNETLAIGLSLGGEALGLATAAAQTEFGRQGYIQSLGLANEALGDTIPRRVRTIMGRFAVNGFRQDARDKGNRTSQWESTKSLIGSARRGILLPTFRTGLSDEFGIAEAVVDHSKIAHTVVDLGKYDGVFPEKAARTALRRIPGWETVDIITTPYSHTTASGRGGIARVHNVTRRLLSPGF